jgi:hypothetical protein
MAGLVPAIHVFGWPRKKVVDARVKPGHDESTTTRRHTSAFPRRDSPELCKKLSAPRIVRGRREDRVRAAPAVSRARWIAKRTRAYRFSGNTPAFPAQWFYGFLRALPGERLSCHRRPCRNLFPRELDTSAGVSGPHDFAVREAAPFVSALIAPEAARVHRIPIPTFATIMIRPSERDGTAQNLPLIWVCDQADGVRHFNTTGKSVRWLFGGTASEIFLQTGLDSRIAKSRK